VAGAREVNLTTTNSLPYEVKTIKPVRKCQLCGHESATEVIPDQSWIGGHGWVLLQVCEDEEACIARSGGRK
jgi:hypothetical protein